MSNDRELRALERELWPILARRLNLATSPGSVPVIVNNTRQDRFDTYGGATLAQNASAALYWLQLTRMESPETWAAGTFDTTYMIEGVNAIRGATVTSISVGTDGIIYDYGVNKDFTADGRFATTDYVTLFIRPAAALGQGTIFFLAPDASNYYFKHFTSLAAGQNFLSVLRSGFTAIGAPSWTTVRKVQIAFLDISPFNVHVDNLQIIKADPADGTKYNATGAAWDFFADSGAAYAWTILTDVPGVPNALAQLATVAGRRYSAVYVSPQDYTLREDLAAGALAREAGKFGLWWGEDYNNCYELRLDTAANEIKLLVYSGAAISATLGTVTPRGFTLAVNTKYYLGLRREPDGTLKAYVTTLPSQMYSAAALQISVVDTTYPSGTVGFVSYGINARFFELRGGSPQYAIVAEWAKVAENALALLQVEGTARLTVETVEEARVRLLLRGVGFRQIGGTPSIELEEDDTTNQNYEIVLDAGVLHFRRNNDVFGGAVSVLDLNVDETAKFFGKLTVPELDIDGVNFDTGTAFPGSPAADDLFYRTDINFLCYFDGTRWLTTQVFTHEINIANVAATTDDIAAFLFRHSYDPYVTHISVHSNVLTTNNGTNFWTVAFADLDGVYANPTVYHSFSTGTTPDTAGTNTDHSTGTMSVTPVLTKKKYGKLTVTKTLAPGNLYVTALIEYRLIVV